MHLHDNLNDATRFTFYTEAVLAASERPGFTFTVHPIRQIGSIGRNLDFRAEKHPTRYTAQFSDGKYA